MTGGKKIIIKVISLGILAACLTIALVSVALARRDEAIYPSNVAVGGISISNLNQQNAGEKLKAEMGKEWDNKLRLKIVKHSDVVSIPLTELGIEYNLDASLHKVDEYLNNASPLGWNLQHAVIRGEAINVAPVLDIKNKNLLNSKILEIKNKLDKPATDARVIYTKGYLEYLVHDNGYTVDLEASLETIRKSLARGSLGPVSLVVKDLYPKVKAEDIKSIDSLIGVSVTDLDAWQINDPVLKQILSKINGTIVMPGDGFSINSAVNQLTPPNQESSARLQQIIQKLSNTMENAGQSAHLSMTATDSGKVQLINNLGNPLMLHLAVEDNKLLVKIFGCQTDKGKEILLIKEQTLISPEIEVKVDRKLKPGDKIVTQGKEGKKVSTYRVVKIKGEEIEKRLLSEEIIPARNTIMIVAPGTTVK